MDVLAAWGVLLMAGSLVIGLASCIVSIGFSAGVFQYQTLAIEVFRAKFAAITGSTVEEYIKTIPRFRRFFGRIPSGTGPSRDIGDGIRLLAGRPVSLTRERWWKTLDAIKDGPAWPMTEDAERRLQAIALHCANLPIKDGPPDDLKAKTFSGRRQAEILLARTKVDIDRAQTLDELFAAYLAHRAIVRRRWVHALTGGRRKLLKAKATPQVIFWKKILAYAGGGATSLVVLCSVVLRSQNLQHIHWSVIGGGIGLFLFSAGAIKAGSRGRLAGKDRTPYRVLMQRQPLVATGLMSGQVVVAVIASIMMLVLVLLALNFLAGFATGLSLGLMGS